MENLDYLLEEHPEWALIIITLIIVFIAGWFLHAFITRNRPVKRPAFQFFCEDTLYNFNDALVLIEYRRGWEGDNLTYLVKFSDGKFFEIVFNVSLGPETPKEISKEKIIEELKKLTKFYPEKSLAALKLLEAV
jgi:hypothetical protein